MMIWGKIHGGTPLRTNCEHDTNFKFNFMWNFKIVIAIILQSAKNSKYWSTSLRLNCDHLENYKFSTAYKLRWCVFYCDQAANCDHQTLFGYAIIFLTAIKLRLKCNIPPTELKLQLDRTLRCVQTATVFVLLRSFAAIISTATKLRKSTATILIAVYSRHSYREVAVYIWANFFLLGY